MLFQTHCTLWCPSLRADAPPHSDFRRQGAGASVAYASRLPEPRTPAAPSQDSFLRRCFSPTCLPQCRWPGDEILARRVWGSWANRYVSDARLLINKSYSGSPRSLSFPRSGNATSVCDFSGLGSGVPVTFAVCESCCAASDATRGKGGRVFAVNDRVAVLCWTCPWGCF